MPEHVETNHYQDPFHIQPVWWMRSLKFTSWVRCYDFHLHVSTTFQNTVCGNNSPFIFTSNVKHLKLAHQKSCLQTTFFRVPQIQYQLLCSLAPTKNKMNKNNTNKTMLPKLAWKSSFGFFLFWFLYHKHSYVFIHIAFICTSFSTGIPSVCVLSPRHQVQGHQESRIKI